MCAIVTSPVVFSSVRLWPATLTAAIGLAVGHPSSAGPRTTRPTPAPQVVFLSPQGLALQAASGGPLRKPSAAQVRVWRSRARGTLPLVSPGVGYGVVRRPDSEWVEHGPFKIVRQYDGVDMRTDIGRHSSIDGDQVVFDGWLDARYFAVWLEGMAPNGGSISRRIMDVLVTEDVGTAGASSNSLAEPVRHCPFNGWLGPRGRTAIALKGQGNRWTVGDKPADVDSSMAEESDRIVFPPKADPYFVSSSPIAILAISSPVDLRSFDLAEARAIPLVLDGKPFEGLAILSPDFAGDRIVRRPTVEFSRDGWWALIHRQQTVRKVSIQTEYLVSLKTGIVRRLPGSQAAFL